MANWLQCARYFVAAGLVVAGAQSATAQAPGSRVPRGGSEDGDSGLRFQLSLDAAEAYDDNLLADAGFVSPSALQISGFYSMFAATTGVDARGKRVQFTSTAGANVRYYADVSQWLAASQHVGASLASQLNRRTTLVLRQGASHAPVQFGLFAAQPSSVPVPATSDFATSGGSSYNYSTDVVLAHNLTPRSALSFSGDFRYADFVGNDPLFTDLRSYGAGGRYLYNLDRNLKLIMGYTFRNAQYSLFQRSVEHSGDMGLEYARPLSATRKMVVSFSLGPTVANGPVVALQTGEDRQQYRLMGEGSVAYPMSRTWNLRATYRRGTTYVESLPKPVFTNGVTVTAGGFASRRSDLSLSAAYSEGDALAGASAAFTTYTGAARYSLSLNRAWAAYGEYLYYFYEFDRNLTLPQGVSPQLSRNSVRLGLTLRAGSRGN